MKTKTSNIFAVSERFLKSDEPPVRLPQGHIRKGKSRRNGKNGGSVGIILKSDADNISVLDDNRLNSKNDDKERL